MDIDPTGQEGELGFRIGKDFTGKGISCKAMQLLLAKEPGIKRINAETTNSNFASLKVLENNGFRQITLSDEVWELNSEQTKFVHYILEI